jgi:hypothetical protein
MTFRVLPPIWPLHISRQSRVLRCLHCNPLTQIQSSRREAQPNPGFLRQLQEYEAYLQNKVRFRLPVKNCETLWPSYGMQAG